MGGGGGTVAPGLDGGGGGGAAVGALEGGGGGAPRPLAGGGGGPELWGGGGGGGGGPPLHGGGGGGAEMKQNNFELPATQHLKVFQRPAEKEHRLCLAFCKDLCACANFTSSGLKWIQLNISYAYRANQAKHSLCQSYIF